MFRGQVVRQASRLLARPAFTTPKARPSFASSSVPTKIRPLSSSAFPRIPSDRELEDSSTGSTPGASGDHEGKFARTDDAVRFEHPEEKDMPASKPVRGRGGEHALPTLSTFSLEGRVVVVTGGARGLGLVMAQGCIISGSDLAIVDLNKEEGEKQAESLLKTYKEENPGARLPKITVHYCDVSNPESVTECFQEIVGEHGKVDNVVTSAGFCENIEAVSYPYDKMKKLWGVNVDGTWLWAVEAAKHFMSRNAPGSIVCIGSMSGSIVNVPQPQAPYNASKAAVRHLVSSFAVEWAQSNVRINCISPGYMLTALTKKILDNNPDLHRSWTSLIPQGKMGRPEDLMGAVVFLCSDASSYMTGADMVIDGGYTRT